MRIGDNVTARAEITLRMSATPTSPPLTIIVPIGTPGTVAYLVDDDDDAVGVRWITCQMIIEVNKAHCEPA